MKETIVGVVAGNMPQLTNLNSVTAFAAVLSQASNDPTQVTSSCLSSLLTASSTLVSTMTAVTSASSNFEDVNATAQSLFAITANAVNVVATNGSNLDAQYAQTIEQHLSAITQNVLSQKVVGEQMSTYAQNGMSLSCQINTVDSFQDSKWLRTLTVRATVEHCFSLEFCNQI